jgi:hypothetical protein
MDASQTVDRRQPLHELGLDTQMAVDLTKKIGDGAHNTLPSTILFNYPTVDELSGYLEQRLLQPAVAAAAAPEGPKHADAVAAFTRELDDLSQQEVEALLESELGQLDDLIGSN